MPELEERIGRAQDKLRSGKKVLETAAEHRARRDRGAQGARAAGPGRLHGAHARRAGRRPGQGRRATDIRRYLSFFVQDTWKAWTEAEGELIAAELERLAEKIIQVANENIRDVARAVTGELGPSETKVEIKVDTLKYDASVFALGALGHDDLPVRQHAGRRRADAGGAGARVRAQGQGRRRDQGRGQGAGAGRRRSRRGAGRAQAGRDRSTASARACSSSSSQAGDALSRGIADVLDQALRERKTATPSTPPPPTWSSWIDARSRACARSTSASPTSGSACGRGTATRQRSEPSRRLPRPPAES